MAELVRDEKDDSDCFSLRSEFCNLVRWDAKMDRSRINFSKFIFPFIAQNRQISVKQKWQLFFYFHV